MTQIQTDLLVTRERAGQLRVEPTGLVTATNVQGALEQISVQANVSNPIPVHVTTAVYNALSTDRIIYVSYAGPVTLNLPTAASRGRLDMVIKDTSGNASTNNISIYPNATDTGDIDGLDPLVINSDYGSFFLAPDTLAWRVTT